MYEGNIVAYTQERGFRNIFVPKSEFGEKFNQTLRKILFLLLFYYLLCGNFSNFVSILENLMKIKFSMEYSNWSLKKSIQFFSSLELIDLSRI